MKTAEQKAALVRRTQAWQKLHPDYQKKWALAHPLSAERRLMKKQQDSERHRNSTPERRAKKRAYMKAWAKTHRRDRRGYHREWRMGRDYGLSLDAYAALFESQGGRCAVCADAVATLHVDHDHESGRVRGLLCPRCNLAPGGFGDSAERLRAAIAYLERGS